MSRAVEDAALRRAAPDGRRHPATLGETYDAIEREVREAVAFEKGLQRRHLTHSVSPIIRPLARPTFAFIDRFPPRAWLYLREKSEELREGLARDASDEDRANRFFDSATASYFIDALAARFRTQFRLTPAQAEGLQKLQAEREQEAATLLSIGSFRAVRGFAVAVVAILAAQLPKETFESLGIVGAYGWYRLGLLLALALILSISWAMSRMYERVEEEGLGMPPRRERRRVAYVMGLVLLVGATEGFESSASRDAERSART
jgi:hypothetical protein